ncbi:MAG: hypothetical protein PHX65_08755 [Sulfurimonas sp.]|nr:hypothetical protein [Sulfurimonas sp.]
MKKVFLIAFLSVMAFGEYVNGYIKSDGTYVNGYVRSAPDSYKYNNYSSQTMGGSERDEFSSQPVYNKSSPSYDYNAKQKEYNQFFESED